MNELDQQALDRQADLHTEDAEVEEERKRREGKRPELATKKAWTVPALARLKGLSETFLRREIREGRLRAARCAERGPWVVMEADYWAYVGEFWPVPPPETPRATSESKPEPEGKRDIKKSA